MEEISRLVAFMEETEKLKAVTRTNKTIDGRFENSAEHSWQAALMAPLFQDYFPEQLSMEKVLSLLLVHDLGEIYAGDTSVFDEAGKAVSHEQEQLSLQRSLSLLPPLQAEKLAALWQEFETGTSPEARYARVIDALIPLINHGLIAKENENPQRLTAEQVLRKKAFIKEAATPLWQLVEKLVAEGVAKGIYL